MVEQPQQGKPALVARLKRILSSFWLFLGRLGLALRRLLTLIIVQPLLLVTTPFRWLGRQLWPFLRPAALPIWRFIGRVGLAERHLLDLVFLDPLRLLAAEAWYRLKGMGLAGRNLLYWFLIEPAALFVRWLWRRLGLLGLALRHLLTLFLLRPLRWLYRHTLRPVLRRLGQWGRRFWQATQPARRRQRRRLRSRWRVRKARLRVRLRRPQAPATAVVAPRSPESSLAAMRRIRLVGAALSVAIVLLVSFVSLQERQPGEASAGNNVLSRVLIASPTPAPPTPTPRPTIPVQLTPWATPDPLRKGGSVAFSQHRHGNSDIYLLPIGYTEAIRLTSHPAPDRQPAWSPDGMQVAFSSKRDGNWEIYVYNLAAGRLRRLTNHPDFDGNPAWSPDSQWLVYEAYRDNNLDIYIIKVDGSDGPYRLTEHEALDFEPVWSPGGRHIAFASWRSGNKDIFLMSLDAVSDETAVNLTRSPAGHEDDPAFAPDGRWLAYVDDSSGFPLLYAIPLAEGQTATGPALNLGLQGRHPVWSPDSQALLYIHNQAERDFLLGGSPQGWGVAPQAYAGDGRLASPSWSAVQLTDEMVRDLAPIDKQAPPAALYVEALAVVTDTTQPPTQLWQIPVNAPSPYLSDQVDQSFRALRQRLQTEAGWDALGSLNHMFQPLDQQMFPGDPAENWNQAGRAFDLDFRLALAFDPRLEVVRQDMGDATYWTVYVRAARQDGTQGEPLPDIPWDFQARYGDEPLYYDAGGKLKESIPSGYYVNFTALAADYGWTRVPAADNWRTYFPGIRFWHFEKREGLTWAEAMRQLYTEDELESVLDR